MTKARALEELGLTFASDGWTKFVVPRSRQMTETLVMDLLYKKEHNATDLAFAKGYIQGILYVLDALPESLIAENSPEVQ